MSDQWYYTENRERRGPFSEAQLKQIAASGQLKPTDLVWKKGMAAWQRASELPWLFPPRSKAAPPPLPPGIVPSVPKVMPPPLPQEASSSAQPGRLFSTKRIAIGGIGVAALGLGILLANLFSRTHNATPTKVASDGGEGPTDSKRQADPQQPAIPDATPAGESGNDANAAHPTTANSKSQSGTDRDTEKAQQLLEGCKIVDLKGRHPRGILFLGKKQTKTFNSDATQWVLVAAIHPSEKAKLDKLTDVIDKMQWFCHEESILHIISRSRKCDWELDIICGEGVCRVKPSVSVSVPVQPWIIRLQQGSFACENYLDLYNKTTKLEKQAVISFLKGQNTE